MCFSVTLTVCEKMCALLNRTNAKQTLDLRDVDTSNIKSVSDKKVFKCLQAIMSALQNLLLWLIYKHLNKTPFSGSLQFRIDFKV